MRMSPAGPPSRPASLDPGRERPAVHDRKAGARAALAHAAAGVAATAPGTPLVRNAMARAPSIRPSLAPETLARAQSFMAGFPEPTLPLRAMVRVSLQVQRAALAARDRIGPVEACRARLQRLVPRVAAGSPEGASLADLIAVLAPDAGGPEWARLASAVRQWDALEAALRRQRLLLAEDLLQPEGPEVLLRDAHASALVQAFGVAAAVRLLFDAAVSDAMGRETGTTDTAGLHALHDAVKAGRAAELLRSTAGRARPTGEAA